MSASARDRILARVRATLARRDTVDHPGPFEGWRPGPGPEDAAPGRPGAGSEPVAAFESLFRSVGGESVRASDGPAAAEWLERFAADFATVALGVGVPGSLRPSRPLAPPEDAALAVSMARGAVAETGSLLLDARDGRRAQLLAPTHVVVLTRATVYHTLVEALAATKADLPSALGLHSGPSKSADIGQVMVRGVHGPGRVVALLVERGPLA